MSISVSRIEKSWKIERPSHHSMQDMCSRICSFPSSIPTYFINNFTREGEIVFDMWSGRGTVPFEALRAKRIGIGNDKSPEAYVLTFAKVNPIDRNELKIYLSRLETRLFSVRLPGTLSYLDRKAAIFYSKKTFEQLIRLKLAISEDSTPPAMFVKAVILGLLHGKGRNTLSLPCSHSYSMSPAYVKKYAKAHKLRRPTRNVIECIRNKIALLYEDSTPEIKGLALNDDSTEIGLESCSVDMILTSPPYFDRQTYAWGNWLRLWFLGYDYRDVRKTLAESGSVERYRQFMTKSIAELFRVLKPGRRCFIVVGDVRVSGGKKFINTAEFLMPLCLEAGFELEQIVVDSIPRGRKVMTYIPESQGIKTERILYLVKPC